MTKKSLFRHMFEAFFPAIVSRALTLFDFYRHLARLFLGK